jgi:hypothetical protein
MRIFAIIASLVCLWTMGYKHFSYILIGDNTSSLSWCEKDRDQEEWQELWNSHIFGTHSFRISGATTLDAGSVDSKTVQRLGGWAVTQTAIEYTQANTGAFTIANRTLLNPNNFTVADLQLQIQTNNEGGKSKTITRT